MKIIYDNDIFTIQRFGGISRYYIELISQIYQEHSQYANPKILNGLHRNDYLTCASKDLSSGLFYVPNFKGAGYLLSKFNSFFNTIFSDTVTDIYHATYYRIPEGLSPNVKKVITVYDMIHELYPSYFKGNDKTAELKASSIIKADHILAISENTKNDLINIYQISPDKITVTYLGVDHFKVQKQEVVEKENFLLYVGPRGGYKNFQNLVIAFADIFRENKNLQLIAFGGGRLSDDEKALIKSLNIPDDSVFQMSGSDSVLKDLYSRALAFVYPSIYEGFGIPPLEAMANGCPVVASKTSSIGEVLGQAALLFDPKDVSDISQKIDNMIASAKVREKYIYSGYQQVKKYTWKKNTQVTLDVYRKLLQ
ncbi:hypothetical protein UF64_00290 [Thalassospira sp. HJ]|uniref:glycosyltransferase family 4 protein n=1 Tax=Thalassospira sp. HJ TaxID=1616823 RepID=UPI0005CE1FF0|nr:glycosyltransferase family 1 protein [Thalassospira sp. HJ]KJE37160.1 hypothetical protein UF64_00290 [Thalassospira sp. HJ]